MTLVQAKLVPVELINMNSSSDKKIMRSFYKKLRFLLFPLLSLGLISIFTFYTLGFIKISGKKGERNILENIDDMKRQVASVNQGINQIGMIDNSEGSQSPEIEVKKSGQILGEMHLDMESSVRSLIQTTCDFDSIEKSVASSQIKFDFMNCEPSGAKMKLINKTNGYEAQIFGIRGKKVSSDFIQLEHGSNELIFEISSTAGQIKSQIIKIKRIQ